MPYQASNIHFIRRGNGPPVLFIHGNPATHSLWHPIAERVAALRTVLALDLPGFGGSPAPEGPTGYAVEELARIIIAFADHHRLERFDLVGHSFGCAVAVAVTIAIPERIASLALITPMVDRIPMLGRLARMRTFRGLGNAAWSNAPGRLRRFFAHHWTHVSYGAGFSRLRAEEVALEADRPDMVIPLCSLMATVDPVRYRTTIEQLASLQNLPLLMIGAGRDRIIPFRDFKQMSNRLPHAEQHIFPDSGHVPMWQYPDEVSALLINFWMR